MTRIATILIFIIPLSGLAQKYQVVPEVTFGTYYMNDMTKFQENYISASGIPAKAVISFPAYGGFGISILRKPNEDQAYGISFGYTTTSGRVSYEDYSGSLAMDQVLKGYSLGAFFQYRIYKSEAWPLYISFNASWVRTNLSLSESIVVGSSINNVSQFNLQSNNIGLRPSLMVKRKLNHVFLQAGIGYEFQIAGRLPMNNGQDEATAQWDGLRLSLGVGIPVSVFKTRETDTK